MMHRIIHTTDNKNFGFLIPDEEIRKGNEVILHEFKFRIDTIREVGDTVVLSNPNYIITCAKE